MDVDTDEDVRTDGIGLDGVEDVTTVDKLATETAGGWGGKRMLATDVITTSVDVVDGEDVVCLGVRSSTSGSSCIFIFLRFLSISLTPDMVTVGKRQRIS